MRRRPARPLLLVDLALPRDVEESAARLQNVFLYNLDDLAKIAEENRSARGAEVARCREILSQRADGLWTSVQRHLPSEVQSSAPTTQKGAGHASQVARP
jgi:glutamyl-tRNA reductase